LRLKVQNSLPCASDASRALPFRLVQVGLFFSFVLYFIWSSKRRRIRLTIPPPPGKKCNTCAGRMRLSLLPWKRLVLLPGERTWTFTFSASERPFLPWVFSRVDARGQEVTRASPANNPFKGACQSGFAFSRSATSDRPFFSYCGRDLGAPIEALGLSVSVAPASGGFLYPRLCCQPVRIVLPTCWPYFT